MNGPPDQPDNEFALGTNQYTLNTAFQDCQWNYSGVVGLA
jgi:hypothetical protein